MIRIDLFSIICGKIYFSLVSEDVNMSYVQSSGPINFIPTTQNEVQPRDEPYDPYKNRKVKSPITYVFKIIKKIK